MEIIIITDGKKESQRLADIFNASIGQIDDFTASVWTEKQYELKKDSFSSDAYMIFIGDTKVRDAFISIPSFKCEYYKYNMRYGWIGKQAILYLSNKFNFKQNDINGFVDLYNVTFNIQPEKNKDAPVKKVKNMNTKKNATLASTALAGVAAAGGIAIAAAGGPITLIGAAVATAFAGSTGSIIGSSFLAKDQIDIYKVRKHSGELLLKTFIDEGLSKFLDHQL